MRFGGLSATGPLRMVAKDRFGSLTVYRGELYSGHSDDKLEGTSHKHVI